MKPLFKLLILGMLYLLSNTTYAQIIQYSDDGTQSCIDCEEKTGTDSDCFCYFFEDVPRFHEVLAKIEAEKREEWLRGKEKILKGVIEDRLSTTYTSYTEAQRAFLKAYSAESYSKSILNDLENNISATQRPKEIEKDKNYYEIRTIEKLFKYNNDGTAYKFGDLKMNGKYLKDIPNQDAVVIHTGLDNKKKEIADQLVGISRILQGIPKIRQNKALEERIVNDFMNHYNGHDFPNRVLLMAKYLIWQNNGHIVGNNPANDPYPPTVFNPNLYDYLGVARDLAINAGQSASVTYPQATDDQAIAFYAMSTFGDNEYNFMMETAQENLRGATQGYLENYQYDTSALGRTNNAIRKYVNNEVAYNSFDNYAIAGSGSTSNVDLNDGANHVYRWKFNSDGENNGLVGLSNFFHELFKLDQNHYELEGSIFRNMFIGNGVDLGDISNHDLGRLYDFSTVYPYGQYRYDLFFDVGTPYLGSLGFTEEAGTAVANGGTVDFDLQIVSDLTGKAACLYNQLNANGNTFIKDLLSKFDGDAEFGLKIISQDKVFGSDGKEVNGNTSPPKDGIIVVRINTNRANSRSSLSVARTIIHELIHADIFRKIKGVGPEYTLDIQGFLQIYNEYVKANLGDQHELMGKLYIDNLKNTIKAFHRDVLTDDYDKFVENLGEPTDTFYESMAWQGLKHHNVKAWTDLTPERQAELDEEFLKAAYLTNSICPNE